MISAGEASGDFHGARLVQAIRGADPQVSFFGMGGKHMEEAGVRLISRITDMAVVGLTEVLSHLKTIHVTMRAMKKALLTYRPELVILIDYPDFHLPLAKAAKRLGLKVMYYISPQVWAWRRGRLKSIKRFVDHMVVILPFEEAIYRKAGIPCTFVGHPLLEVAQINHDKEQAKKLFSLNNKSPVIALLPGSRKKEAERILPIMLKATFLLKEYYPNVAFILPRAETLDNSLIQGIIDAHNASVTVVPGKDIYSAIKASDFAVVTSGTATLDTALMETPMCIVYRVSFLTSLIGRLLIKVRHIGLVNIIAGKEIVPELVQENCTSKRIAETVMSILDEPDRVLEIRNELKKIRDKLGMTGASRKAATLALEMMTHGNIQTTP